MTANLEIRPASPADADALSRLAMRSKAHWGYSQAFMDACREELTYSAQQLDAAGRHFVLAFNGEDLAGFYALEDQRNDRIELGAMFVDPGLIGTGVGRRLMQHAIDHASRLGARWLEIVADPHALAFYQAAGAVQSGECASASIPGRMLPRLLLDLAKQTREPG